MSLRLAKSLRSKFLRDAATLQASGMLNQLSQTASTILIAGILGAQGQGLLVSAISLQALFYFLISVGISQATVSQIAAARARGNREKVAGWLAFMAKSMLLFGAGLALAGWFILPAVSRVLYGDGSDSSEIGLWAWLLCFQVLLEIPRVVAAVAFQGTRRMHSLGQVESGHEVVRAFLVVMGALLTGSPVGAIAGSLAASIVSSVISLGVYARAQREDPGLLPSAGEVMRGMRQVPVLRGLRMGLRAGVVKNISMLLMVVFPRLAIGAVAGVEWVAYFHIAQRILEVPLNFMLGVSRTVLPALSEFAGLRDLTKMRRLFWRVTLISGAMIAAGTLGALPFVKTIVRTCFPESYAEPVARTYWILALGYIPFGFGTAVEAFYLATNNVKWWLGLTLFGITYSVPTHLWLIQNVPDTGTAMGMVCYHSFVLVHLAYITFWFSRHDEHSAWCGATLAPKSHALAKRSSRFA